MHAEVLVTGETLIDFLPERPGPLSRVDGFERRPGGAPANVAVALARLECPPLFWTRVGDDPFGRYLRETLAREGIPDRFLETDPAAQTTLAFVTHDETGDRTFSFYRDDTADTRLESGTVDDDTLAAVDWVHAGGVALSSESSREATLDLCRRAGDSGCTVSFDPNARAELWPDEATFVRVVREALAHVDVLKATDEELRLLGFEGETPEAVARAATEAGPHTVFLTRGEAGALAFASEDAPWPGLVEHGGFDVDVVDTTGAGDAFVAGVIASLGEGHPLEEALHFAGAVAASSTTAPGAMTALPDREAVVALLGGQ
ncbi:carbohydrate kinase family protein [Natronobiforma cellulositropha]|uniref:carbohydrate kinase family protein n=1 Tax=Natronobiforma cellulositropha TaxID=1679076 RepID=UPI0021D5E557|nr:carbohydrate kinase [Natronobiforma cellulositropha]